MNFKRFKVVFLGTVNTIELWDDLNFSLLISDIL